MFYYLIQHGYFATFFFLFLLSLLSTYYYLSIVISIYFNVLEPKSVCISFSNSLMLSLFIILNSFSVFGVNYLFVFIFVLFLMSYQLLFVKSSCSSFRVYVKQKHKIYGFIASGELKRHPNSNIFIRFNSIKFRYYMSHLLVIQVFCSILLNLYIMHGISKYYIYSARLSVYEDLELLKFIRRVAISDLVNVEYFTDGFFNIKFYGFCIAKSYKGIASSFEISDKFSLSQRFFVFSPCLKKITIFTRRLKKRYLLNNFYLHCIYFCSLTVEFRTSDSVMWVQLLPGLLYMGS